MLKRLAIYLGISSVWNYNFQLFRVVYMLLSSLNNMSETSYWSVGKNFTFVRSSPLRYRRAVSTTNIDNKKKKCIVSKWSTYWNVFRHKPSKNTEKSASSYCKAEYREMRKSRGADWTQLWVCAERARARASSLVTGRYCTPSCDTISQYARTTNISGGNIWATAFLRYLLDKARLHNYYNKPRALLKHAHCVEDVVAKQIREHDRLMLTTKNTQLWTSMKEACHLF